MNLTLLTAAISAAVAGAAGFGLAWQLQDGNISELNLEHANERISIQRAARTTIERTTGAVIAAQNAAASRAVVLRRDADAARTAADGLRLATEATVRTVEADPSTCNSIIAAYSAMATASSDFIERVSRDADQCHSDVELMRESWPR